MKRRTANQSYSTSIFCKWLLRPSQARSLACESSIPQTKLTHSLFFELFDLAANVALLLLRNHGQILEECVSPKAQTIMPFASLSSADVT